MRSEIAAAVYFLTRLAAKKNRTEARKIELFAERLAVALQEKFRGHWYPDNPSRGQAYRCIRVNLVQREDPELLRACRESGLKYGDLGLPLELTLWVDPGEVCCRYGEDNPCFSVATYSCHDNDDRDVARMVTSTVERVMSDYHSGSSSDEDGVRTFAHCAYQELNPDAPAWYPKTAVAERGRLLPLHHSSFSPHIRTPLSFRQNVRVPSGSKGRPGTWDL